MLVSHKHQFIFIKTYKTGGSSLEAYLERFCLPEGSDSNDHWRDESISDVGIVGFRKQVKRPSGVKFYEHQSIEEVARLMDPDQFNAYTKFAVMRNPFEVALSDFWMRRKLSNGYSWVKRHQNWARYILKTKNFVGCDNVMFSHAGKDAAKAFRKWVQQDAHVSILKSYPLIHIHDKVVLDKVVRYEGFTASLRELLSKLDIIFENSELKNYKGSFRDRNVSYRHFFDEATIHKIEELYPYEINQMGYSFENANL